MTTATGITLHPAPESRPPETFADHAELLRATAPSAYVQGALLFEFPDPVDDEPPRPRTPRRDLPDPAPLAAQLGQAVLEVVRGSRSLPQLVRWTTPEVYAGLARRATTSQRLSPAQARTSRAPVRVRRVVICEPADGVAEASVVVVDGTRVRALALRLVGVNGRWRLADLATG